MLIMLLLLDLVRLVPGTFKVSILDFLASRPVSRSREPSLGLFDSASASGLTKREAAGSFEPLVGILDIAPATEGSSCWLNRVKEGVNISRNFLSGEDNKSLKVIHNL